MSDSMKVEAAATVVVDLPAPPRSADDGIVIFACEAHGFLTTVKDPPRGPRPVCPTCGQRTKHVGHETVRRMMEKAGG